MPRAAAAAAWPGARPVGPSPPGGARRAAEVEQRLGEVKTRQADVVDPGRRRPAVPGPATATPASRPSGRRRRRRSRRAGSPTSDRPPAGIRQRHPGTWAARRPPDARYGPAACAAGPAGPRGCRDDDRADGQQLAGYRRPQVHGGLRPHPPLGQRLRRPHPTQEQQAAAATCSSEPTTAIECRGAAAAMGAGGRTTPCRPAPGQVHQGPAPRSRRRQRRAAALGQRDARRAVHVGLEVHEGRRPGNTSASAPITTPCSSTGTPTRRAPAWRKAARAPG